MVASLGIDYNSSEVNTHLVTRSRKMLNTQKKCKRVKVEAGLMKNIILFAVRAGFADVIHDFIGTVIFVPF